MAVRASYIRCSASPSSIFRPAENSTSCQRPPSLPGSCWMARLCVYHDKTHPKFHMQVQTRVRKIIYVKMCSYLFVILCCKNVRRLCWFLFFEPKCVSELVAPKKVQLVISLPKLRPKPGLIPSHLKRTGSTSTCKGHPQKARCNVKVQTTEVRAIPQLGTEVQGGPERCLIQKRSRVEPCWTSILFLFFPGVLSKSKYCVLSITIHLMLHFPGYDEVIMMLQVSRLEHGGKKGNGFWWVKDTY